MLPAETYYIVVLSDLPRVAGSPYIVSYEERPSIFMDVDENTPHLSHINWLSTTGITKGWAEDGGYTFRPYASVARCDMAAFLYRLAGEPDFDVASAPAFSDVGASTPHRRAILWLSASGVSRGWDNGDGTYSFRTYANAACCDMAAFLHRMSEQGLVPSA